MPLVFDSAPVLDHGYVKLVEHWGCDESIISAARMSTGKGFVAWGDAAAPGCEKLLRYLWENNHATPFEMAGAIFEVQAPIFVFREWHRHRTQSYNELSARYTEMPEQFYMPSIERLERAGQSKTNKQAGDDELNPYTALIAQTAIVDCQKAANAMYRQLLEMGVAREVARVVLPVGQYSRMRASASLRNWLSFVTLRDAPNAQWEIRQYAKLVLAALASCFPRTCALFAETHRPG